MKGWVYQQATGILLFDGIFVYQGYSGSPEGLNDPDKQMMVSVGPIPCGNYTIGKATDVNGGPHGPFVLRLTPDEATARLIRSFERDTYSFLCHGPKNGENSLTSGTRTASEGCIIMPRIIRVQIDKSENKHLCVVAGR